MASRRYTCDFRGCTFSTDSIEALAAHDVETGHPNPDGGPFAPAAARLEELCERLGGHEPSPGNPGQCRDCGATIRASIGGRYRCLEAGCDFTADSPGEVALHDVAVHPLREVAPVVPDKLRRLLQQSMCESRGHVPNPINPAACLACGSRLEVFRA